MPDDVEDMKAGRVVTSALGEQSSTVWYYEEGLLKNQVRAHRQGRRGLGGTSRALDGPGCGCISGPRQKPPRSSISLNWCVCVAVTTLGSPQPPPASVGRWVEAWFGGLLWVRGSGSLVLARPGSMRLPWAPGWRVLLLHGVGQPSAIGGTWARRCPLAFALVGASLPIATLRLAWPGADGLDPACLQVAPTMSLQVIGPVGKGAKVVLWSETRIPRQTWRIDDSGRIWSQMFEDRILDVKGESGACLHWGPCCSRLLGASWALSPSPKPPRDVAGAWGALGSHTWSRSPSAGTGGGCFSPWQE